MNFDIEVGRGAQCGCKFWAYFAWIYLVIFRNFNNFTWTYFCGTKYVLITSNELRIDKKNEIPAKLPIANSQLKLLKTKVILI